MLVHARSLTPKRQPMRTLSTVIELAVEVEYTKFADGDIEIESVKSNGKVIDLACITQDERDRVIADIDEQERFDYLDDTYAVVEPGDTL
jgi:hypothetical protein